MGAFELGFSQGADRSASNLARSRQLQDEQRQQNLQRNWGILNDPNSAPELKQQAGQDIQNQYPTPEHKGTFLSDILHLHLGHKSAQPIPPTPPSANPISGALAAPDQSAKDQLGVPYASAAPATTPSATPAPATPQQPLAAVKAAGSAPTPQAAMDLWKQYRGPTAINEGIAQQHAAKAAEYAQALETQRAQAAIDLAKTRGNMGIGITPENRFLNQYAAQHGFGSAAEMNADETGEAMKAYRASNATPGWKSFTDGNNVYAIDSHNPNGQRTLIGHKDDLTQRQEFRTMTNPDGSTFLVPVTVWSKKGSSFPVMETQDGSAPISASTPQGPGGAAQPASGAPATPPAQSGAPVSSATPQGVPGASATPANPGARPAGASPSGGAKKQAPTRIPSSSVGAPIPFGGKPSELTKSDTSQYTKLAEDSNAKQESLQIAQESAQSPSPTSDKSLVYAWVRANVQGAGRMTQSEFQNALSTGSFDQRVSNWLSQATTGKMTPEIRQMMMGDIQRSARTAQAIADSARTRVQQDMQGNKPASSKTRNPPGSNQEPVVFDGKGNPVRYSGNGSRKDPNNYVSAK